MIAGQVVAHIKGQQVGPLQRLHINSVLNILIFLIPGSPRNLLRHGISEVGCPVQCLKAVQLHGLARVHVPHEYHLVVKEHRHILNLLAVVIGQGP